MTKSLPPRPSLVQLKHQAKDLLKTHQQRNAAVCDTLRELHRFSHASDDEILAAAVILTDVQHAIALSYGFTSWAALKRHVELLQGMPILQRDGCRTIITGFESVDWGGSFFTRQESFIACFQQILQAWGYEVTYNTVAGVSGSAFKFVSAPSGWCPSHAICDVGFDCVTEALRAFGISRKVIDLGDEHDPDRYLRVWGAITTSIENGIPALYCDGERSLVVGYNEENHTFVCRPYPGEKPGYTETEELRGMFGPAWFVELFQPDASVPEPHDTLINAFRIAVSLFRVADAGQDIVRGMAAYDTWIDLLQNPPENVNLHGHAYVYASLMVARQAAADYLISIAHDLSGTVAERLQAAGVCYRRIYQRLSEHQDIVSYPWQQAWTPGNRVREMEMMRLNQEDERTAVHELDCVIQLMTDLPRQ